MDLSNVSRGSTVTYVGPVEPSATAIKIVCNTWSCLFTRISPIWLLQTMSKFTLCYDVVI